MSIYINTNRFWSSAILKSLAEILEKKDLITAYCKVFDYDNPKLIYLGTNGCLNLVVDDIDATYNGDVLLENILSDKLECKVYVMILQEIPEQLKAIHTTNMAELDDKEKIELIFEKSYKELYVEDRNLDKIGLAHYEDLKDSISKAFLSKGKPSPYTFPTSKAVEKLEPNKSSDETKSRKREKSKTLFFEDKLEATPSFKEKRHKKNISNEDSSLKSQKLTKRSP
jgi:hypothetical protein